MQLIESIRFWTWFLNPLPPLASEPTVKICNTRGVVKKVSTIGTLLHVVVEHEKIDRFHERDGSISVVQPTMMVFSVSKTVSKSLLQTGGKIAFAFEVRWDREPALTITHVEPLPDEIVLQLTPAQC